jgi:hypothetical protein
VLLVITFRGTDEALEATTYDLDELDAVAGTESGSADRPTAGPGAPSDRGRADQT